MRHHRWDKHVWRIGDFGPPKPLRSDANHREHVSVDSQRLADDVFARGKTLLPTFVGDDRHGLATWSLIFFGREIAATKWCYLQNIEVVTGNQKAPDSFIVVVMADAHRREPVSHQAREGMVSISIIFVVE